jgi:hypothetical protein
MRRLGASAGPLLGHGCQGSGSPDVLETQATTLTKQVGQLMDLLRDVQNDVGSVNERLDRVIEARQLQPRPPDGFKPP